GENGLHAIKDALAAPPKAAPPLHGEVIVSHDMPLGKDFTGIPKAAQEEIAKEKGGDKVIVSLQGGEALKLHFDMHLALVKLRAEMNKAQKSAPAKPRAEKSTPKPPAEKKSVPPKPPADE